MTQDSSVPGRTGCASNGFRDRRAMVGTCTDANEGAPLRYRPAPMPRLVANLSYLFTERPFLDWFEAAARWGFRAVEHQFPYTPEESG